MIKTLPLFFVLFILMGCNKGIDLPSLNESDFSSDKNGCSGIRSKMTENLRKDKEMLLGLDQDSIIKTLGKPDRNELYKRNQKFFFYQLSPAIDCDNVDKSKANTYLSIRFNATGMAKEILIVNDSY